MSDNAREIFIKNLRYIMEKKGITQADICRELKIPSATMSNWFTGQRYPRIDKMQQLADFLLSLGIPAKTPPDLSVAMR